MNENDEMHKKLDHRWKKKSCGKKTYNYVLKSWGSCGDLFEDTRKHPIKKMELLCSTCSGDKK